MHRPVAPEAYDCVTVTIVRSGSAFLFGEFGRRTISVGDVLLLGSNVVCGFEPEGHVTATTIYAATDYLIDQVFWQHAGLVQDRLEARGLAETMYVDPAQILHLGEDRAGTLMPWLDELVRLSIDGDCMRRFNRVQALWFSVADVIAPFVTFTPVRSSPTRHTASHPSSLRHRRFTAVRPEALQVREMLHRRYAQPWSMDKLARLVHLSARHLTRVFIRAYGKTPMTYLTMVRVQEMARLLRETDLSVAESGWAVGWRSRSGASIAFKLSTGMSPSHYRRMGRQ